MDEIKLTKEADALMCVLYREYLQRRKTGISKAEAKLFAGSEYIHTQLMTKWSFEDIDETCRELSRAGVLNCNYADDVTDTAGISDAGIIYMENRFTDGIASVFSYLERIRTILPW